MKGPKEKKGGKKDELEKVKGERRKEKGKGKGKKRKRKRKRKRTRSRRRRECRTVGDLNSSRLNFEPSGALVS